jgi:hypothetical protein
MQRPVGRYCIRQSSLCCDVIYVNMELNPWVSAGWVKQQGVNSWLLTREESEWILTPRSQEKVLQVSKRGSKICKGKQHKLYMRAKGGIDQGDDTVNVFAHA